VPIAALPSLLQLSPEANLQALAARGQERPQKSGFGLSPEPDQRFLAHQSWTAAQQSRTPIMWQREPAKNRLTLQSSIANDGRSRCAWVCS
jgi:hypothetical protein